MGNGMRRSEKLVRKVKATTYGVSLRVMPQFTHANKYAGKAYGPHRKKIADEMKRVRKHIKGRYPGSKYAKGVSSVDIHYLR